MAKEASQSEPVRRRDAIRRLVRRCLIVAALLLVGAVAVAIGKATQLAAVDYLGGWLGFDLAAFVGLGLFAAAALFLASRFPRLRR